MYYMKIKPSKHFYFLYFKKIMYLSMEIQVPKCSLFLCRVCVHQCSHFVVYINNHLNKTYHHSRRKRWQWGSQVSTSFFLIGNLLVGRVCTMDKFRHRKISPSRTPDTSALFRVVGKENTDRSGVFSLVLYEILIRLDHSTLGNVQQRFKRTL